jgi:hypothetical protein
MTLDIGVKTTDAKDYVLADKTHSDAMVTYITG